MLGHVMAPHDKLCLLRNTRLALAATVLFAGGGVLYLLKLANEVPVARHDPLLPFMLVGAAILQRALAVGSAQWTAGYNDLYLQ